MKAVDLTKSVNKEKVNLNNNAHNVKKTNKKKTLMCSLFIKYNDGIWYKYGVTCFFFFNDRLLTQGNGGGYF